jgi:hypothetical protein
MLKNSKPPFWVEMAALGLTTPPFSRMRVAIAPSSAELVAR